MTGYMFPAMVSTTQVEKLGNEEFANHPVATGPFQWNHEVKDVRTVMDRNEDYWDADAGKGPFLDQIVWVPREEVAARVTSLQTGETDLIFIPPPDQIPQLLDQGFKISQGRPPHVWFMWTNQGNPINRDVRVRRAISMALDRQGLATDLLRDTVIPAYGSLVPGMPAFDPDFVSYPYDPAEANKLMSAAGVESMESAWWFPSAGSGNILPVQMAQWMQRNFAEIGFTMKIEAVEWTAFGGMWLSLSSDSVSS